MRFPEQFIAATHEFCTYEKYVNAPLMRKSFNLTSKVKEANILVSGLGFYQLYVNGNLVSKLLAPYISAPSDILYYDSYDICPFLLEGENVIGLILGNGMQNGLGGYIWDFHLASWRSAPKAALGLNLTYENGEIFELTADESFLTSPSPIYFDDLRSGEYYDARLEQPGWSEPGFDASNWKQALLATSPGGEKRLCMADPIVVTGEMKPVSITKQDDGYLYDFGINEAGLTRLNITGLAGQEITLSHKENAPNYGAEFSNEKFQPPGYAQTDKYICKGDGKETFVPRFTYHGFRYVMVTGITEAQATPELLTYLIMHSDLKERGGFTCSDPIANTLQELTRRSTLSNFHYFPTDCPHREKNGWTGDAAISAEHTLLNLSAENSYREWLRSVCKAQNQHGALPGIVPTGGWGFKWGNGPAWDCVLTYLPYYVYKYRGDKTILEENATGIFRYLHYIHRSQDEKGLIELGLGDWCPPGRGADQYKSPLVLTDSIICYDICKKASFIFNELGWVSEYRYACEVRDSLYISIRKHLIDFDTMIAAGNCQTSQAMILYYSLVDKEQKKAAQAQLLRMIEENGGFMDTGILGARVIFHVLYDMGESDLAYKMITRPEYPSYGNWVARGATTLWENFHPDEEGIWSRNHHFFGDISSWFIQCIAGIRYNLNDDGKACIMPSFIKALDFAEGFYDAPEGRIYVKWIRKNDSEIELTIDVPAETGQGQIMLEKGWVFGCSPSPENHAKPLKGGTYLVKAQA